MTIIRGSVETFEDAPMLQGVVESAMTNSLGLQLDAAGLYGTGQNNQPTGIKSNDNVNVVAASAPVSYSLVSESVERVANQNGTANAIIMAPRSFYQLDRKLSSVDGQPLRAFPSYDGLQKFVALMSQFCVRHGSMSQLLRRVRLLAFCTSHPCVQRLRWVDVNCSTSRVPNGERGGRVLVHGAVSAASPVFPAP